MGTYLVLGAICWAVFILIGLFSSDGDPFLIFIAIVAALMAAMLWPLALVIGVIWLICVGLSILVDR